MNFHLERKKSTRVGFAVGVSSEGMIVECEEAGEVNEGLRKANHDPYFELSLVFRLMTSLC